MLSRQMKAELRETIFRHLDGIVTAPTATVLAEGGVLEAIVARGVCDLDTLAGEFGANPGYLNVALRVLASQGWLDYEAKLDGESVSISANALSKIAFGMIPLYTDAVNLMKLSGKYHPRRFEIEPFRAMEKALQNYWMQVDQSPPVGSPDAEVRSQILKHVEGVIIGPTIVHLGMTGMFHKYFMEASFRPDEFHEDAASFGRLLAFFERLGWFTSNGTTFRFTDTGLYFARRASAYGVTVSYAPTLRQLDQLIFGDPDKVLAVDAAGKEQHVDREMNVWGSGGAHTGYFRAIDEVIIEIFNRPIEEQPKGILDMGCGNGAFLIHLFDVIDQRTLRGQMLQDYPLFLVGVDFNEASLRVTRANLTQAGIWAKVIWGDLGNPNQLSDDLQSDYGIALGDLLNVRTFLDHNRPWKPAQAGNRLGTSTGAYSCRGQRLTAAEVEESLLLHLEAWVPHLAKYGLLIVELHTLPPALTAKNLGKTAATAYDATHGYSDQYIVEVDTFNAIAAEAGLKGSTEYHRRFPDSELATVTINYLTVI